MESKPGRLIRGSDAAKAFMAELRAKRGKKGGGTPAPPACDCPPAPKEEINIEPPPVEAKRRSRKKITVDFNNV